MAHPDTMIGGGNVNRKLDDGCDRCMFSKVYCDAVTQLDRRPCCDSCTHT